MEEIELVAHPTDNRSLMATRTRVEQLIAEGWTVIDRFPLVLQRGRAQLEVRANGIIITK